MPIDSLYVLMRHMLPDTVKIHSLVKYAIFKPESTIIEYVVTKEQVAAIMQHIAEKIKLFTLLG